jgi:hypothetical protein
MTPGIFSASLVSADDPRRRDAGALDLREQHARQVHVVDVLGLPETVEAAVRTRGALTDCGRLASRVRDLHVDRERHQRRGRRLSQQLFSVD